MIKSLALLAFAWILSGCVNFGEKRDTPAVVSYVLSDTRSATPAVAVRADAPKDSDPLRAQVPQGGMESYALKDSDPLRAQARAESYAPTLLVLDTTTASFYDTDQLVFGRTEGTRGQYQFARWTERPGKRFADLMRARLDQQDVWRVSAAGGYVRGDVLLDTELVEFYHDATSEPGQVRLELRAELVDLKQRSLLGRRTFKQTVPLASFDAPGVAQASNLAVSRALDELTVWLATFR
jgi:cholesterol transport system auxiliary component